MSGFVPFVRILALLEEHGWDYTRIKKPFRVFTKRGRSPILIQVDDNTVSADDFERIKRAIAEDQAQDGS